MSLHLIKDAIEKIAEEDNKKTKAAIVGGTMAGLTGLGVHKFREALEAPKRKDIDGFSQAWRKELHEGDLANARSGVYKKLDEAKTRHLKDKFKNRPNATNDRNSAHWEERINIGRKIDELKNIRETKKLHDELSNSAYVRASSHADSATKIREGLKKVPFYLKKRYMMPAAGVLAAGGYLATRKKDK